MTKKLTKRQKMAAGKTAGWVRHIAASKRKPFRRSLGTFGPASEVRIIDPASIRPPAQDAAE